MASARKRRCWPGTWRTSAANGLPPSSTPRMSSAVSLLARFWSDIEKGTEEIATFVGGPFRAHVPNSVRSLLAVRLQAGDDVEREVGEAKFLELVVGPDPHPAFDGDVVSDHSDVVEFSRVRRATAHDVELKYARPSFGLVPGDALEHDVGVEKIGARVHAALPVRVAKNRYVEAHVAFNHVVDVEPELVAIAGV